MTDFDKYYEATEPGYRERAIGWATAIGLQDVDGLKPSKFLVETAKRNIEGEITAKKARELVRANYENQRKNVEKTRLPLEEFFKVLLFGYEIELKNRFLRIGQEYGTKKAAAIGGLHRHDVVINRDDVVINVVIKLIRGNSQISADSIILSSSVNRFCDLFCG